MRTRVGGLVLVLAALTLGGCAGDDAVVATTATTAMKPAGPTVKLTVDKGRSGALRFTMSANGVMIEPAGEVHPGAGHFHLIADAGCVTKGQVIPKDADHVHLGKGQMEGKIYLEPGAHTLCLQVGDGAHMALPITDTAKVTIGIGNLAQWCGAIGDLNGLYESLATLGADFPAQQGAYANVRRLVAQLRAAISAVDATAKSDVTAELDVTDQFAAAFTQATDAKDAEARVQKAFPKGRNENTPGRAWITANCADAA